MLKKYQYLKKYVIRNSEGLVYTIQEEAEKKRAQVIRRHRTVAMIPILEKPEQFDGMLPEKVMFAQFILDPLEGAPPRISPQLIQQSSHLFSLLHSKTAQLLEALIEKQGTPEFNILVVSSIPSLFGYFSSPEHLQLAFSFYMRVLQVAPHNLRTQILSPLFDSPVAFKFFESVYQPFFDRFIRDERILEPSVAERKTIIYVNELISNVVKSRFLLHSCHASILKFMYTLWSEKDTKEFIINKWLRNHAQRWLHSKSGDSLSSVLDKVFEKIMSTSEYYKKILFNICDPSRSEPLFEIPDQYTVFEQPFLMFYSSVADLSLLARTISSKCELSPAMAIFQSETSPKNVMFWFKIFPKRNLPKSFAQRPMVFQETSVRVVDDPELERIWRKVVNAAEDAEQEPFDFLCLGAMESIRRSFPKGFDEFALSLSVNQLVSSANQFEQFLRFKLAVAEIDRWTRAVEEYEDIMLLPICLRFAAFAWSISHNTNAALAKASAYFGSPFIRQAQFFVIVSRQLPELLKPFDRSLGKIGARWDRTIKRLVQESQGLNLGLRSPVTNNMFWESVEHLRSVDRGDLFASFRMVVGIMRVLESVRAVECTKQPLFQLAIELSMPPSLPWLYIVLSAFALGVPSFASLLSDEEQFLWLAFERAFLSIAVKDEEMVKEVFSLQAQLRSVHLSGL